MAAGASASAVTRRLVERFASEQAVGHPAAPADLDRLTPRELEVLTLLGRGLANAELAARLTLSKATVKSRDGPGPAGRLRRAAVRAPGGH
ncbi:LuxR C-terminal-related transcriptional regulator [Streptomyces sp. NPDC001651]|uniref:LuxR C-terminal-related transcriptional regulator n=1 Tax=Streptomyces sp. NPDC001651 TaxID=3364596 RepID=UPI0036B0227B